MKSRGQSKPVQASQSWSNLVKIKSHPGERWQNFGVRGHDRALELDDMSSSPKAATCRRTPKAALALTRSSRPVGHRAYNSDIVLRAGRVPYPSAVRMGDGRPKRV